MHMIVNAEERDKFGRESKELVPKCMLHAMTGLVVATLIIVSTAVLTGREPGGQPKTAAVLQSRDVLLSGEDNAILMTTVAGHVILDLEEGGFITAVRSGLDRKRLVSGVAGNPPVTLARLANGRVTLTDPATGWVVELTNFGDAKATVWAPVFK
ncbi:MAG: photosynthetic complex assembly protein [Rhodobacteraceae bacterium]|nr:photosynthetic complex assembly protein [Paracoccaceae bacterium]